MAGKPDLVCTTTREGLSVHLRDTGEHSQPTQALCGVQPVQPSVFAYFSLNGCLRCAAKARNLGCTRVADIDGEDVTLDGFTPLA